MADENTTAAAEPARSSVQDREVELQAANDKLRQELSQQRQRVEDLEKRASGRGDLERKLKATQGELKKAEATALDAMEKAEAAQAEAAQLRDLLQQSATGTLAGLPKAAVQLSESATLPGIEGERLDAHAGDVLLAGTRAQASELQESVGAAYRVFAVPKESILEAKRLGLLKR